MESRPPSSLSSSLSSTTSTSTSSSSPSSTVGIVVGSTILALFLLAAILALLLWWFSPTLQARNQHRDPHSFAPLDTTDNTTNLSRRISNKHQREPRISVPDDFDTASSFLGQGEEEKNVGLNRSWSVGSFYKRWRNKEGGGDGSDEWWNPLEEEERRSRELEQGGSSSDHHTTRRPSSRLARLVRVRWGARTGKRLSDVQESSAERLSFGVEPRNRGSMVLPPLDDAPQPFNDEIDPYIPSSFYPAVPTGPNSRNLSSATTLHATRDDSYEEDPSSTSLTPSFRAYVQLIQRSLSSASFGSRSITKSSQPDPSASLPSLHLDLNNNERRVADLQRTASSSTFGPLPINTTSHLLPSSHSSNTNPKLRSLPSNPSSTSPSSPRNNNNHPCLLPAPNSLNISPAVSFGSSFANYVGAIQRSLSLSRSTTLGSNANSNSTPTRRSSPAVSRAPTSKTFGTHRSRSREEEEEEARLVGSGRGGGGWEEEETMESHGNGTLEEEGELVEVWGRGMMIGTGTGTTGGVGGGGGGGGREKRRRGEELGGREVEVDLRGETERGGGGGGGGVRRDEGGGGGEKGV